MKPPTTPRAVFVLPDFARIASETAARLRAFDAAAFEQLVRERLRAFDAAAFEQLVRERLRAVETGRRQAEAEAKAYE